ncbi:hypothetical protein E2562_025833 [Oryza meyeriana var. granulata]|uniref:Uncharacterized protein n=1 Tax=Oryza meyeriana var. granulata TaxID=110450 RepID=A0A6G1E1X8_9ORYZ|nr:hypothetical protein E2562_025833 [Oryza meyeriana var. granulata]
MRVLLGAAVQLYGCREDRGEEGGYYRQWRLATAAGVVREEHCRSSRSEEGGGLQACAAPAAASLARQALQPHSALSSLATSIVPQIEEPQRQRRHTPAAARGYDHSTVSLVPCDGLDGRRQGRGEVPLERPHFGHPTPGAADLMHMSHNAHAVVDLHRACSRDGEAGNEATGCDAAADLEDVAGGRFGGHIGGI